MKTIKTAQSSRFLKNTKIYPLEIRLLQPMFTGMLAEQLTTVILQFLFLIDSERPVRA